MAFNESAYYANKVKQLNQTGYQGKKNWSVSDVKKAFADKGLSAKDHYSKYGKAEGVSPTASVSPTSSRTKSSSLPSNTSRSSRSSSIATGNSRFDENTYFNSKVAQLNQTGYQGRNDWTVGQVKSAFDKAGMTAQQHYEKYGKNEGVSPVPITSNNNTSSRTTQIGKINPSELAPGTGNAWRLPTGDVVTQAELRNLSLGDRTGGGTISRTDAAEAGIPDSYFGGGNSGSNGGLIERAEPQNNSYNSTSTSSAGWLENLLQSNSPLMQRSASQGQQIANSRGLLNSSMAAEAAQGAMIDRATPLAQQDAQYWQNRGINEQQYGFQRGLNAQQYGFQSALSDQQYQQSRGLNQQQYGFQRGLNEQGYQFDMGRMQADFGFSSELATQEASQALNQLYATSTANAWGVMANNLTDIVGQYSSQLERIQTNPDIEEADKATLIEQVLTMRDTDINFQRSLYEQLPTYLANTGVFPNR